jgi:hypothetical protein
MMHPQNIGTSIVTTIFTIFTSLGLAAVSAYFASERYIFLRYHGKKWVVDVLLDYKRQFLMLPGINRIRRIWRGFKRRLRIARKAVARFSSKIVNLLLAQSSDYEKSDDLEANILPVSKGHSRDMSAMTSVAHLTGVPETSSPPSEPAALGNPTVPTTSEAGTTGPTKGKLLWKNALQTIRMRSMAAPHRQRTASSMGDERVRTRKRTLMDEPVMAISMRSRISTLQRKVLKLEAAEALEAHQALVRHLQFSPDGKFLATSR